MWLAVFRAAQFSDHVSLPDHAKQMQRKGRHIGQEMSKTSCLSREKDGPPADPASGLGDT